MTPSKNQVIVVCVSPGKIVACAVDWPRIILQRTVGSLGFSGFKEVQTVEWGVFIGFIRFIRFPSCIEPRLDDVPVDLELDGSGRECRKLTNQQQSKR
jgi:hypothetical protein